MLQFQGILGGVAVLKSHYLEPRSVADDKEVKHDVD